MSHNIAIRNGWKWNVEKLNSIIKNSPNNWVVINDVSDFPNQTATTIILETGNTYVIGTPITTSKRFIVQTGVDITGGCFSDLTLTYTGTGDMFTTVDAAWSLTFITYACPNGRIFNCTGAGVTLVEATSCVDCKDIGLFTGTGFSSANFSNSNFLSVSGQGFQFTGTFFVYSITKVYMNGLSPTYVSMDLSNALFYNIEIQNVESYGVSGGISLKGTTGSANLLADRVATVKDATLNGGGITPLSIITPSDIRWHFEGNAGIPDTLEDALLYFNGNVTPTAITATSNNGSNAVTVNAVWTLDRISKFTATSGGVVTYRGEREITVPLDISVNILGTTGGAQDVTIYLFKNNVVIPATARRDEINNSRSKVFHIPWQITLQKNDTLHVRVENNTSTSNVIVTQGIMRLR